MQIAAALILSTVPLLAQFTGLAVTDDGEQIYFVSAVPLRGEALPGGGIYRWTDGQFERFVDPLAMVEPGLPFHRDVRGRPVVSGGGTVVSWTDEHACVGGSACIANPTNWASTIRIAAGQTIEVGGQVQISRNGRYVTNGQEVYVFSTPYRVSRQLRDLQSGTLTELDFLPRGVLSDGRVLGSGTDGWFLWKLSGQRERISRRTFPAALVSDNGTRLIGVVPSQSGSDPELLSVASGSLQETSLGSGTPAGISNDGSRLLVLSGSPAQAFVVNTATGIRRAVFGEKQDIAAAVLAGFGQIAVFGTTDGRLLMVNLDLGTVVELAPETPVIDVRTVGVPCGALRIGGSNLIANAAPRVTLDDNQIPVIAAAPDAIWVQVPCELDLVPPNRTLELAHNSPFSAASPIEIRRVWPLLILLAQDSSAIHQDFGARVDSAHPARPGEVVHFWGTGFGRVDRPVRTGEQGPANPLARLIDPISCVDLRTNTPLELPFAGLAPGMIGFFQIDLRVPVSVTSDMGVRCGFGDDTFIGFFLPVAPSP